MVMNITGATRRLRNPGVVSELAFLACFSDTLETLYCGTTPGSQSQVGPHRSTIRGWP